MKFKSGVYKLTLGSQEVSVYCQMGIGGCGSGGWTSVMKINGRKVFVHLDYHNFCQLVTFSLISCYKGNAYFLK